MPALQAHCSKQRKSPRATAADWARASGQKPPQVIAVACGHHHARRPRCGARCRGGPGVNVDILVNNAGGPPPGDFRDWQRDQWMAAVDANMLTPIELIKAVVDGMAARGFGRIVNITSSAVKAPIDILGPVQWGPQRLDRFYCRAGPLGAGRQGHHHEQPAARQV